MARFPATPRDSSRLLVLDRKSGAVSHALFRDIAGHLRAGDCLVLNDTKVLPAKLAGRKETGGKFELLLIRPESPGTGRWLALSRDAKAGGRVSFPGGLEAVCLGREAQGEWLFEFSRKDLEAYMAAAGSPPLPQYIINARKRRAGSPQPGEDPGNYQTVYAKHPGAIAAPTAGFHFTGPLLETIRSNGVSTAFVTLHVGWGTFRPLKTPDPSGHRMLPERCFLSPETAEIINKARAAGGRIVAVGTSSVRTLETFSSPEGLLSGGERDASLFIYPGYRFRAVDAFVTNLHVPRSTPLYMTAAFAGKELLLKAYREAVERKYRFYSYGDSMIIL